MQRVRLGRTSLMVSAVGLGCGGHSRLGMATGNDEHHAADIVRSAIDVDIDFIDTARVYGTERAVGAAVHGIRDKIVISTKAMVTNRDGMLSAQEITASLEHSLNQLRTDYVDIFHLHGVTVEQYPHCRDVLVPELLRQKAAGKIRFLGITERFSDDTAHATFSSHALPDNLFDVVMVGFNLLNPSARRSVFPQTIAQDVGTLIMFAVRRALNSDDAVREAVGKLIACGEIAANAIDVSDPLGFVRQAPGVNSVVEAAYRFCRHEPGAHVVLTGTGNKAHLAENVASILAPPLPAEVSARLRTIFGDINSVSGN